MMHVRRLTLQLTPLLDLLLIVMFAQYMQMQITAKQDSERITRERIAAETETEGLREQVDRWESQQRQFNQQQQEERVLLGQLIRELFHIPESAINKVIQPRSKSDTGLSSSEIAELKARFQQLANSRGDQVVDHLLTFNEMRKQFDIWEFYLNENGELMITIGADRQVVKSKVIETPEEFVDAALQVRRKFPPTKNAVLLLCRYGDCRLMNKLAMTRGLPAMASRMKADGQGTVHFEYAVFGYRPQPELDKQ